MSFQKVLGIRYVQVGDLSESSSNQLNYRSKKSNMNNNQNLKLLWPFMEFETSLWKQIKQQQQNLNFTEEHKWLYYITE